MAMGLSSVAGAWVVANGRRVLNMVSLNFLGVAGDPAVMVRAPTLHKRQYSVKDVCPLSFHVETGDPLFRCTVNCVYMYTSNVTPIVHTENGSSSPPAGPEVRRSAALLSSATCMLIACPGRAHTPRRRSAQRR